MACSKCYAGWTSPCRFCEEPVEEEVCSMAGCPNCGETLNQVFICIKETEDSVKICKECFACGEEYAYFEDK